jgi:hypothetical protein
MTPLQQLAFDIDFWSELMRRASTPRQRYEASRQLAAHLVTRAVFRGFQAREKQRTIIDLLNQ